MTRPLGLVGKAYRRTFVVLAIVSAVIVLGFLK